MIAGTFTFDLNVGLWHRSSGLGMMSDLSLQHSSSVAGQSNYLDFSDLLTWSLIAATGIVENFGKNYLGVDNRKKRCMGVNRRMPSKPLRRSLSSKSD
jgi:hypothetical protein